MSVVRLDAVNEPIEVADLAFGWHWMREAQVHRTVQVEKGILVLACPEFPQFKALGTRRRTRWEAGIKVGCRLQDEIVIVGRVDPSGELTAKIADER